MQQDQVQCCGHAWDHCRPQNVYLGDSHSHSMAGEE